MPRHRTAESSTSCPPTPAGRRISRATNRGLEPGRQDECDFQHETTVSRGRPIGCPHSSADPLGAQVGCPVAPVPLGHAQPPELRWCDGSRWSDAPELADLSSVKVRASRRVGISEGGDELTRRHLVADFHGDAARLKVPVRGEDVSIPPRGRRGCRSARQRSEVRVGRPATAPADPPGPRRRSRRRPRTRLPRTRSAARSPIRPRRRCARPRRAPSRWRKSRGSRCGGHCRRGGGPGGGSGRSIRSRPAIRLPQRGRNRMLPGASSRKPGLSEGSRKPSASICPHAGTLQSCVASDNASAVSWFASYARRVDGIAIARRHRGFRAGAGTPRATLL